MSERQTPPSTPRWVKIFGIIAIVLILLFIILKLTGIGGEHGPERHFSSDNYSLYTTPIVIRMQQV
jgi:hypothetical protein